jgi:hypothetical protein
MFRPKKKYIINTPATTYTSPEVSEPFDNTNEFISFCTEHLDYMRMIELPDLIPIEYHIQETSHSSEDTITNHIKKTICKLEKKGENTPFILQEIAKKDYSQDESISSKSIQKQAILVYFESSPHIEFIIRNVILKLGAYWSHSIVCGNSNYEFMQRVASTISNKITIIKLENCENSIQHNQYMKTPEYWNLLVGAKILHYTSNTTIFKKNIDEFMDYDYISASSFHQLGTGSLSLRTKQTMIDILEKFNDENHESEDMYFSRIMNENSIAKLADRDTSSKFSTEYVKNPESMGGHKYWYDDDNWKHRLLENVVIQFKPLHNINEQEFRGGWKTVIYKLIECKFFSECSETVFLDILEQHFSLNKNNIFENKWRGIVHLTPNGPPYLSNENIANLFSNSYFLKSMEHCSCLFTLSPRVTNYLQNKFIEIERPCKIITLKHPVVQENIIPFSFEKFKENPHKRLIQIGQQYRKMTSIYIVPVPENYTKMWLTGTMNFKRLKYIMNLEQKYLNIRITKKTEKNVIKYYTRSYEEYDEYLCKNIVFIDLFDAAANNAVLECIIRKTPLIVNRIQGVIDYLGENYPLYFSNIWEIPELLSENKLLEAHEYLKTIDTKSLEIDYFIRKLLTHIHSD